MKKNFLLFSSLFIALSACTPNTNKNSSIETNSSLESAKQNNITFSKLYNGKETNTVHMYIINYAKNANNPSYLAEVMYNRKKEYEDGINNVYDYQRVNISWESVDKNETFTVHVADNKEFDNEFTYETDKTSVSTEIGIFIPGKTYYYKVEGSNSGYSEVDSFIAKSPVRYISADTVINMRDLGGWKTADGKKLAYGKLYRGAALDEGISRSELSDKSRKVFDYLGIKSEIDLRGDDSGGPEATKYVNKINPNNPILREGLTYLAYDQLIIDSGIYRAKQNLPKIFEFLANEDNYPIYFHCSVGADRTGTLAYVLESLLGVRYEDIMVEYELTSFSNMKTISATRVRGLAMKDGDNYYFREPQKDDTSFSGLGYAHSLLMKAYEDYSTNLQEVMEKYLLDVGVKQAHIDKVKEIMLSE